jgi:anti-sigma factor ChrR (cupin superfamily)
MRINADVTQPAMVVSADLPWVASPLPGVERRMLERDGDEVARVTSLVRYAPGSHFSRHTHTGGEEFLVLEGTFSDDYGEFPTGTYVRNPIGSAHTPHTKGGCLILVKLHWMLPDDQTFVRVDTTREDLWQPGDAPGVEIMDLHRYDAETVTLQRLAAGATLAARSVPGGEEIFVLDGACTNAEDDRGPWRAGTWARWPIGRAPALYSAEGCRLYVKRGHLRQLPAPPPA